jgi:hypothetical protein
MSEDFKIWWHREGSGMPPLKAEDTCEHVERVSAIAWANGAYKATEALEAENVRLKAEVERLTNQNALATPRHLIASQDIKTLREQIEELKLENSQYEEHHKYGQNVITSLREEVERLTKAVMHSPAAQIKLKELEGKSTFDEINPKEGNKP